MIIAAAILAGVVMVGFAIWVASAQNAWPDPIPYNREADDDADYS